MKREDGKKMKEEVKLKENGGEDREERWFERK